MLLDCALISLRNALQFVRITRLLKKRVPKFSQLLSTVLLPELYRPKSPTDNSGDFRIVKNCQVSGLKPHLKLIKIRRKIALLSLSFDPRAQ